MNPEGKRENKAKETDRLVIKPDGLSVEEIEFEAKEKKARKYNVFIRGVRTSGPRVKEETSTLLANVINRQVEIRAVRAIKGGLLLEMESMKGKTELLRRKEDLERINIGIENDNTKRERSTGLVAAGRIKVKK